MKRLLPVFALAAAMAVPALAEIDFKKAVLPILNQHCMECHKAPATVNGRLKKPKGDLRLDGKAFILKGGDGGKVITPGKSAQSELYTRTILPPDHDDIMPPKDGPLKVGDRLVLKQWINEGATFGSWVGAKPVIVANPSKPAATSIAPRKSAVPGPNFTALAAGLSVPSAKQVQQIRTESKLTITALAKGSPLLRVDTSTEPSSVTNQQLAKLQPLGRHITHLGLARTSVSKLDVLPAFPKLLRLDLSGSQISAPELRHLAGLKSLRSLNLHSTEIGDAAIPDLIKLGSLQSLYLWNTNITPQGLKRLQTALPKTKIVSSSELP